MTWVLIVALLISQSYAYASVPCGSNKDVSSQQLNAMGDMGSMDHSPAVVDMPKHMHQDIQLQEMVMDCCDQECSCPTGVCSSTSATLSHFITPPSLNLAAKPSDFYLFSIQATFLPSLRKPPIIG